MPHMPPSLAERRYGVVSCHVERPLDDGVWRRFAALQARRPGGFRIAALMRPPDAAAGEDEERWLDRAREAARRGPFGLHTHFVGPAHARPPEPGPEHGDLVRRQLAWLRGRGLEPTLFCGGGWYTDEGVRRALAEAGVADCTATAFRPPYLPPGAPRLELDAPAWLDVDGGRLLALPSTHSLGMAARAALAPLPQPVVHVYFHDTDLLDRRRSAALALALAVLGRRRRATDLDALAASLTGAAGPRPAAGSTRGPGGGRVAS
jgi:hypothetical protein